MIEDPTKVQTRAELAKFATSEFKYDSSDGLLEIDEPVFKFGPDSDLRGIAALLAKEDRVYIDTETVFFREDYTGDCALIQMTLPNAGCTVLIQTVTDFDREAQTTVQRDISALKDQLEREDLTLVAHSAWFEKSVLKQHGIEPKDFSDTQHRGRSVRPDITSKGLAAFAEYIPNPACTLSKEQQTSDWLPPHTPEQDAYAARDTIVLKKLDRAIQRMEEATAIEPDMPAEEVLKLRNESVIRLNELHAEHPQYLEWEAKKKAAMDYLADSVEPGTEVIEHPAGKVIPGRERTELDVDQLIEDLCERTSDQQQEQALLEKIMPLVSMTSGKGKAIDILKPHRALFGIEKVKDLEEFIDQSMKRPERVSYQVIDLPVEERTTPKHEIPKCTDPAEVMQGLRENEMKRLKFLQYECPEIALLRLQVRACDKELIGRKTKEVTGQGSVVQSNSKPYLDLDDLVERLKQSLVAADTKDVLGQLDVTASKSIDRDRLKEEVLMHPDFEYLGLADSSERKTLWQAISVPTGKFSSNRASPNILPEAA